MIPKTSTDWRGRISTVGRLDLHYQIQSNPLILTIGSSQIKNMVAAAHALAVYHNTKVSMSHLELVINLKSHIILNEGRTRLVSKQNGHAVCL